MELNEIRDNAGATHYRKRVGRGIGSGTGKTAAKGHKGQKARRRVRLGFEGGQNPLYRRLPKRGFTNIFKNKYFALNVNLIEQFLNKKILEDNTLINLKLLQDKNIVGKGFDGISLLGNGDINYKIEIEVSKVSKTALEKMEKAGGKVIVVSTSKEDSDNVKTKAKKAEK